MHSSKLVVVGAALVAAGCAAIGVAGPEIDPVDDTFLTDGMADGYGFDDKSIQAYLVLRGCNTLSYEQLSGEVGLHPDVARAVVEHRMGPDRAPGTADDDPFDTLGELDAVPHFGVIAVTKLVEYMTAERVSGGQYDDGDSGVVAVTALDSEGRVKNLCSGTLIAPQVVLTAAHCLEPGQKFDVYFGSKLFEEGADPVRRGHATVVASLVHPAWDRIDMMNDIALLALREPAPAVPVPLQRQPASADWAGRDVRLVGFGVSDGAMRAGAGTKRQLLTTLDSVQDSLMLVKQTNGQGSCFGDSGGPLLVTTDGVERVAGVTSFGDALCTNLTVYARVDRYLDFLDSFVEAHGGWERCEPRVLTSTSKPLQVMRQSGSLLVFTDGSTIWRMPTEGGDPTILAYGLEEPLQLEATGSDVLYLSRSDDDLAIVALPISGGPERQIEEASCFAIDSQHLYWGDPHLQRRPLDSGADGAPPASFGSVTFFSFDSPFFVRDGVVFYVTRDVRVAYFWSASLGGGKRELVQFQQDDVTLSDVDSDAKFIYFSTQYGLWSVDKVSQTNRRLVNGAVSSFEVEGSNLLVAEPAVGTLVRMPATGGMPEVIAENQGGAANLIVDGVALYWTAGTHVVRLPRGACGI